MEMANQANIDSLANIENQANIENIEDQANIENIENQANIANLENPENVKRPLELGNAVPKVQLGIAEHLISGGIAGALSKTCTAPLSRLTILFQIQGMGATTNLVNSNVLVEASRILREEGIKAFWKGNGAAVIHRFPYTAISFYAYEQYQKLFLRCFSSPFQGQDQGQNHGHTRGLYMASCLVSGGLAGLTTASLNYPLDLVRTRLASQTNVMYYKGISHALTTICCEEGFKGLYKGLGTTLLFVGPNIAINFCAYETLKRSWKSRHPESSNVVTSLLCGSAAGICSSSLTFPIDLLRRRMQLEGAGGRAHGAGALGTLKTIIKSEGFRGLYKGILPEYAKVMPAVAVSFATYDFLKRILTTNK